LIRIDPGPVRDPALNLAIEEHFVRALPREVRAILLYVNDPCVVVGKNQVVYAESDLAFLSARGIPVVRRMSGGGAVWHDRGNLNFSILEPHRAGEPLRTRERLMPIVDALHRLGVAAELGPRNEILSGAYKVSGTAQFAGVASTFVHGTLLFDAELGNLRAALRVDRERVRSAAVASVPAAVANLRPSLPGIDTAESFADRLLGALAHDAAIPRVTPAVADWSRIRELAETKYRSWDWTFGRSPRFTIRRGPDAAGREAELTVEGGRIAAVRCAGVDAAGLEARLRGVRYAREEIESACGDPLTAAWLHD